MLALDRAIGIVVVLATFFVLLALIAVTRTILSRTPPSWRRYRIGVFVERDGDGDDLDG